MAEMLDGLLFRGMLLHASAAVDARRQEINELNVFPVPDGDTGTNMSMTLQAAAAELRSMNAPALNEAAEKAASAMLRGARGNSGVILSLLFRGFSRSLKGQKTATPADLAEAMNEGVRAAYKAVMKPTEGTILTVSRLAADAAAEAAAAEEATLESVLGSACAAAETALAGTVEQNPVLKKAGVVDAGGMGYLTILNAFLQILHGDTEPEAEAAPVAAAASEPGDSVFAKFDTETDIRFPYCTEFIVARENDRSVELLRSYLASVGDSAVILEDEEVIKVHVHSGCPGEVLTEALRYGALQSVKVENMRLQHHDRLEAAAKPAEAPAPTKPLGIVAVCAGDGLASLFRELGADEIVSGGQTMNPSTEMLLEAALRTGAEHVLILPNNKNIIMAAQQCAALTDRSVTVVPTASVQQGVSAMLVLDSDGSAEENAAAMSAAAEGVSSFSVTYAARDSVFDGLDIREGEYLALQDGKLLASSADCAQLADRLLDALEACEPEFISIFYGDSVSDSEAEKLRDRTAERLPDAEISVVNGGQPVYSFLISAE